MFDENQIVKVKWNSKIKKHYVDKGYTYTKMGDEFDVKAKDLTDGSHVEVACNCDYCGKSFVLSYKMYRKSVDTGKICCARCQPRKVSDTLKERYGVSNMSQLDFVKEKKRQKSLEKYGTEYTLQAKEVRDAGKQTMLKKYGVEHALQSDEILSRMLFGMYERGTVPRSKPEIKVCDMLAELYGKKNCFPAHPVDKVTLDCLLLYNGCLIDVEYDGKYYHKDRMEYDNRRNYMLIKKGYKVLRIKGNKYDEIPSKEQIKNAVDYLVHNHSLTYIDMNK